MSAAAAWSTAGHPKLNSITARVFSTSSNDTILAGVGPFNDPQWNRQADDRYAQQHDHVEERDQRVRLIPQHRDFRLAPDDRGAALSAASTSAARSAWRAAASPGWQLAYAQCDRPDEQERPDRGLGADGQEHRNPADPPPVGDMRQPRVS